MIMDNMPNVKRGDIVAVEHGWVKTFALLPHRTVSGRWAWLKSVYVRRVWVYTGFVDEPETQYGDLFDVLQ
jgi:hypothetical protein